ncbi:MAG TPA: ComEC/Rec2 family competence protein [Candidatus Kapabacteria bacterium]|nr:ComEC/Rec2 family competence protein [Candidatus Kapabacteria bacterium]
MQKAIFNGKIISILDKDSNLRIVAEGDLDAKSLPKIENTKIILKVSDLCKLRAKLRVGSYFYSTLKIRAPHKKLINQDFDELKYFQINNYSFYAFAKAQDLVILKEASYYDGLVDKIKVNIKQKIYQLYDLQIAPIALAILIGDKSAIDIETKRSFSFTGTAHLLAVSGTHVGIIATLVFMLLSVIYNRWLKFTIFIFIMIAFIIITGSEASAIRAGLMSIIIVLGMTLERNVHPLNSLSLASILMLIYNNSLFYSPAFQMSVGSVLGIIIFYNVIYTHLKQLNKKNITIINNIFLSVSISIAASIVVSPIVAYYFDVFSIISLIANLIEIPLFTMSMFGIIISIICSYIYMPLAQFLALSSNFLLGQLLSINYMLSKINYAYILGQSAFYLSILVSIYLSYIILSNSIRLLIFRVSVLLVFTTIIIKYQSPNLKKESHSIIIPTANYIYAINDTSNKVDPTIYIFDRKNGLKPYFDKYLSYIVDNFSKPTIYYCGNYGIALTDYYKGKSNIASIMIMPSMSDTISKYLNLKTNFIQYISYEH